MIAIFFGLIGTFVRVLQDDFMRFEQARGLLFRLFAPAWRSFNAGHGGYVFCHRHAHPPSSWIRSAIASTNSPCCSACLSNNRCN